MRPDVEDIRARLRDGEYHDGEPLVGELRALLDYAERLRAEGGGVA